MMKNFKKIICLMVALVMLSSSLSVFAVELDYKLPYEYMEQKEFEYMDSIFKFDVGEFVSQGESSDVEDEPVVSSEDMKNFEILTTFGIWDDASIPGDEYVTKSEFSVIVARAKLGTGNALEGVYNNNLTVSNVTNADLLKYFLEGLGYYNRCAEFNYSDESLLIVANQIGLINKNIAISNLKSNVTRSTLAKVVLKALTIDLCEMTYASYGYAYEVVKGKNLLSSVHGIYDLSGYVNAVPHISVYGGKRPMQGRMEIDRRELFTGETAVSDYLGTQVTAYAKLDEVSGLYTLIYIAENEEYENLELNFDELDFVSDSILRYIDADGDEQEVDVVNVSNIIQNTDKINSLTEMADFRNKNGKIILSSSKDADVYDSAVIWVYDYFVVRSNSEVNKKIFLDYNLRYNNNDYLERIDNGVEDIYIDGEPSEWKKIPAGAVIRVLRSADGSYTQIYAKKNSSVAGTVTQKEDEIYTIDDTAQYKITKNLESYIDYCVITDDETILPLDKKIFEIVVGTKGTFYTFDDYIVVYTQGSNYSYAYLKSASPSRSVVDPSCTIRIFTQNGEWLDCPVAEKVTLDGKTNAKVEDVINLFRTNSSVVGELIRYQVNAKNEIIAIDTIVDSSYEANDSTRIIIPTETPAIVTGNIASWNRETLGGLSRPYLLGGNTVVFVIPKNLDYEKGYLAGTSTILNGPVTLKVYTPSEVNIPSVVMSVVTDSNGGGSSTISLNDFTAAQNGVYTFVYVEKITRVVIDAEKMEYGYKYTCSEFYWSQTRGGGTVREKTYITTDEEYKNDPTPPAVGNFLLVPSKATSLASKAVVIADGVVPAVPDKNSPHSNILYTGDLGNQFVGSGVIEGIDYINQYVKVRSGSSIMVMVPAAKGIIDTEKQKAKQVDLADFVVGDEVFFHNNQSNASFMFKNQ